METDSTSISAIKETKEMFVILDSCQISPGNPFLYPFFVLDWWSPVYLAHTKAIPSPNRVRTFFWLGIPRESFSSLWSIRSTMRTISFSHLSSSFRWRKLFKRIKRISKTAYQRAHFKEKIEKLKKISKDFWDST